MQNEINPEESIVRDQITADGGMDSDRQQPKVCAMAWRAINNKIMVMLKAVMIVIQAALITIAVGFRNYGVSDLISQHTQTNRYFTLLCIGKILEILRILLR